MSGHNGADDADRRPLVFPPKLDLYCVPDARLTSRYRGCRRTDWLVACTRRACLEWASRSAWERLRFRPTLESEILLLSV